MALTLALRDEKAVIMKSTSTRVAASNTCVKKKEAGSVPQACDLRTLEQRATDDGQVGGRM